MNGSCIVDNTMKTVVLHKLTDGGRQCVIAGPGSHTESYVFPERNLFLLLSEHSITLGLVTEPSPALSMARLIQLQLDNVNKGNYSN